MNRQSFEVLALCPANPVSAELVRASVQCGATGLMDFEWAGGDVRQLSVFWSQLLLSLPKDKAGTLGVRLHVSQAELANALLPTTSDRTLTVVVAGTIPALQAFADRHAKPLAHRWLAEVTSAEGLDALPAQFDGLVARGHEAGGWVGEDTSYILLQKLLKTTERPVFVQGGIGLYTAAACRAVGAAGVVLDDALLLLAESPLTPAQQNELGRLNGVEAKLFGELAGQPLRAYARAGSAALKAADDSSRRVDAGDLTLEDWAAQLAAHAGWASDGSQLLPIGQAIGFAAQYRRDFGSVGKLIQAIRKASIQQIEQAATLATMNEASALALSHGTRFPLAQGPMTRVSDSPAFAAEVAKAGALPFLALALTRGPQVLEMLQATQKLVGDAPWGVGMLGFVPHALRQEQCEAIWQCKPPFALIAGGRPDQAAEFEQRGIATYIHAPAPALLKLYLEQGARRFVFEGRECGGHVGPLASFPLWEQMIAVLLEHTPKGADKSVHVLFAGGIHDARSAAMVAAMTAPLAARGMKVGCLMGTAYLFTKEIVSSRAIVETFQTEAIACARTMNLESGPGHASRCVDTKFAHDFYAERRRLLKEGKSSEEIRDALEDLNLGRLRIASKGVNRGDDGKVVEVPIAQQKSDGMYMIGQVATLRDAAVGIEALHLDVTRGAQSLLESCLPATPKLEQKPSDIAIIGIGVVLPKANDADEYWRNVLGKVSVLREVPESRWDWKLYFDENPKQKDKVYSKWGGFLDEISFDPTRFGIPPKSMKSIDPLQILTLEAASRALADAGYANGGYDRENTSIVLGAGGGAGDLGTQYALRAELPRFVENLSEQVWDRLPEWTEESFAGTLLNVAAGRVANRMDFGGINYTIDAACASSLAAISVAVNELETGRSNVALAGGFDTTQSAYAFMAFAKTSALSGTGQPKTFDTAADGIAISEGVAMVVLKRLADAERDGDRIYGLIKAASGSSDGKALGLTAPRSEGQVRALDRAYAKAGFSPATLGLIEAHGTGTSVGDRAEAQTICRALSEAGAAPKSVALGSVKTILGHTKAAAGVSGMIKVVLAMHRRVLPPHVGVENPIEPIADAASPVMLLKEARPWLAHPAHPRRGGASAFGFGGTNFHVVLEEYPAHAAPAGADRWPHELCLFKAATTAALTEKLTALLPALRQTERLNLAELAFALAREAEAAGAKPVTAAIVASSAVALAADIETLLIQLKGSSKPLPAHIRCNTATPSASGEIAFLFPGQGAQHLNMGRETALYFDELREALELADRVLASHAPLALSSYLMPASAFDEATEAAQAAALTDTRMAQPAIGALSLGYLRLALRLGLKATAAAGHSYGEYSALLSAGVLSAEDFLKLSAVRGEAMASASKSSVPGGMAAVQGRREQITDLIAEFAGVIIANHNTPEQSVISGPKAAVEKAVAKLGQVGLKATVLPVSGAFHTELVAPAKTALSAAISATRFAPATLTVYSNSSALPYPTEPAAMQAQLDAHLLSRVEFVREIEAMHGAGCRVFVELGPKSICSNMARATLAGKTALAVSLDGNGGGLRGLLSGLAELFVAGVAWRATALFARRDLALLDLATVLERGRAPVLPKHTWMVSGGCARPIDDLVLRTGLAPALTAATRQTAAAAQIASLTPPPQMVSVPGPQVAAAPMMASTALSSDALIAYQQTMRQFLSLQERVVQQFISGAAAPAAALPIAPVMAAAPRIEAPPTAAAPATVLAAPAPAPIIAVAAVVASAAPDFAALLLGIVAERTGYPTDMLGLEADLEADLGIDSIKRVEIIGAFRKALPTSLAEAMQASMEGFTKAKSLAALLARITALAGAVPVSAPQVVRAVPAAAARVDAKALLLDIVAERTGYPTDMLGLEADLEADLGIDSIKRVEIIGALRKALPATLSEAMQAQMERFTRAKSLAAILAALDTLQVAPAAETSTTVTVETTTVTTVVTTAAVPVMDLQALLLDIVAERTGYPTDMLGLEADLEADLGIDSIKRVEIIGALRKALPATLAEAMQANMERFTKAKSLAAVLKQLDTLRTTTAPAPAMTATAPASAPLLSVVSTPKPLARYVIQPRALPLAQATRSLRGLAVLLGEPDALLEGLAEQLQAGGLTPVAIPATDRDGLDAALARACAAHGPVVALIHLHGLKRGAASTLAEWRSAYQREVLGLFHALQALGTDLANAQVIAVSRLGGRFGRDSSGAGQATGGGANGMLNCLRYEYPNARLRAVDFDGQTDAEIALRLTQELFADDQAYEAGYVGTTRYGSVTAAQVLLPRPEAAAVKPAGDWVVLATGGARGITAGILEAMALPGMRLVLLGRTAAPAPESAETAPFKDAVALKKALLAARIARGEKPKPVEIDREVGKVLVDREIRDNLVRLAATGAVVDYRACDVRDETSFGALIDSLYATHGRIDAVLHAAGVIEDKLLADKTAESFERVLGTKLDAAFVLSQKLKPDTLKALTFFTSVAGRYGNRGQSDYAAGNEILNRLAWQLHRQWPGVRVSSMNWGPWDAGMASEGVKAALRERGMEPIPLADGCRFYLDELAYAAPSQVEVVAGVGPWGNDAVALPDHDPAVVPAAASTPSRIRHELRVGAGGAVLADALFDPAADGLNAHALATELLTEFVALGWPTWALRELIDLRVEGLSEASGSVQLRAKAATHSEPGVQSVTVELLAVGGKKALARATALLVPTSESAAVAKPLRSRETKVA
ncbi:MAG: SDR family NAD(P)-dependent oxidoreductase [Pseudomonadota bacterium]